MRVGCTHDAIALNPGIGDLACNVPVAQANNQPIFWRVVFVLVLEDETFTGIVVSLSLTTPLEFNLVTLEVLFVLHNFNEPLSG